jgi:uncharacterized protein
MVYTLLELIDDVKTSQNIGSVSRLTLTLEVVGKGTAECEIVRHLSPLTISRILKALPLRDRVHRLEDKLVYIETGLMIGAEKQRTQFKRGDVAYMTSNASLCVFIRDSAASAMNPLGIIKSKLDLLEATRTGDVIVLKYPDN